MRSEITTNEGNNGRGIASDIHKALRVLFEPEHVVEVRGFKGRETVSGYYDDYDTLARVAKELDASGYQVYVTLNEVNPDLLARAANRIEKYPKSTTSDTDIVQIRWLPLDFDPVRPSNISSSKEEKKAAELLAREVREYLRDKGWPDPIVGDSGNGFHLLYRIDLPANQESRDLVKDALESLAFRFDDEQVKVDTGVHNPARIWKLYGTVARKGDSVLNRPHRRSKILKIPTEVHA